MEERKVTYWDDHEAEWFHYETENEAIKAILDRLEKDPESIELCGYARKDPGIKNSSVLADLLENIDVDFGDPEGIPPEPTEAMKEAEKAFLAVVDKEYEVWACEEICRKTINVAEWRKENP